MGTLWPEGHASSTRPSPAQPSVPVRVTVKLSAPLLYRKLPCVSMAWMRKEDWKLATPLVTTAVSVGTFEVAGSTSPG